MSVEGSVEISVEISFEISVEISVDISVDIVALIQTRNFRGISEISKKFPGEILPVSVLSGNPVFNGLRNGPILRTQLQGLAKRARLQRQGQLTT